LRRVGPGARSATSTTAGAATASHDRISTW
jgi:hypothetical protein